MEAIIIGAIVGAFLGWLIAALRSRSKYLGGGYVKTSGMGCGSQIILMVVLAVVGAIIGALIGGVF